MSNTLDNTPPFGETNIAWAAGLFEGEGSIGLLPNGRIRLYLNITDVDVILRYQMIIGGNVGGPYKKEWEDKKPMYRWTQAKQEDVIRTLAWFWPYLGDRRRARAMQLGYEPT